MALNKYGIGLEDVRSVLNTANANIPKGLLFQRRAHVGGRRQRSDVQSGGIRAAHGRVSQRRPPFSVSDIADVVDSVEDIRNMGFCERQAFRDCYRQPPAGANIIDTVDLIRAALPQVKAAIPQSINLNVTQDQTVTIRASVHEVQRTMLISILLVILVVFFFLRSPRATFIPSVAVPVSLIGTFGVMYLCGYSLDNLSLMALTISTGFVVDDAIVVIENITRYLEQGMKPLTASL